jgi:TRAP-type C4-dicarboxylate transport system permease large subunit
MILYGFLSDQSVGDLFTAGLVPGVLLALAYALVIIAMAYLRPAWSTATRRRRWWTMASSCR